MRKLQVWSINRLTVRSEGYNNVRDSNQSFMKGIINFSRSDGWYCFSFEELQQLFVSFYLLIKLDLFASLYNIILKELLVICFPTLTHMTLYGDQRSESILDNTADTYPQLSDLWSSL